MSADSGERLLQNLIELRRGETTATISPEGAWLTDLNGPAGPILHPRGVPAGSDKIRGGCHVCLPNFGPDASGIMKQHGFGREVAWDITEQADDNVTLKLGNMPPSHEGLVCELRYDLRESGIGMRLSARNEGSRQLRIAPGFHPYFAAPDAEQVLVNEESYDVRELSSALELTEPVDMLQLPSRAIKLEQSGLPKWVLWSDHLEEYVCLEPTQATFSFLNQKPMPEELLEPGETREWSLQIDVAA